MSRFVTIPVVQVCSLDEGVQRNLLLPLDLIVVPNHKNKHSIVFFSNTRFASTLKI